VSEKQVQTKNTAAGR